jgi:hypothetical protein
MDIIIDDGGPSQQYVTLDKIFDHPHDNHAYKERKNLYWILSRNQ